jgi:hypothetical protein
MTRHNSRLSGVEGAASPSAQSSSSHSEQFHGTQPAASAAAPAGIHRNIHSLNTLPAVSDAEWSAYRQLLRIQLGVLNSMSRMMGVLRSILGIESVSSPASAAVVAPASPAAASSPSTPRCTVVLVAHGDVCQILATAFLRMDPRLHRSLPHWKNGECRLLQFKTDKQLAAEKATSVAQAHKYCAASSASWP